MDFSVKDRRVVVLGAGRSGRAAARLLVARGAAVTLSDTDTAVLAGGEEAPQDDGITVALGPHTPELLMSADLVVLSPGVSPDHDAVRAARDAGVAVIGEVELASRWLSGRIVAITGTKGKSTTTSLTARMLEEAGFTVTAGGNLGVALSEQVGASRPDALHVVEVSSFQLETTERFHPWIAVLLNLSPDHLDRHASFDEYARAKARIFDNQTADDWAIVNADDRASVSLAEGAAAQRLDFALESSLSNGIGIDQNVIVRRTNRVATPLVPLSLVRLRGRHLLADVLAATAIASVAGVPPAAMQRAVEGFSGLEHALEPAGDIDGIHFVNDSKATNVASALRAIESFEHGVVVIMGGRYKGGAFEDLTAAVRAHVTAVVAIGEAAGSIETALREATEVYRAPSLAEAVRRAFALAAPGGVVLLAPACSSFDMFQDYAARGRAFKAEVARLTTEMKGLQT